MPLVVDATTVRSWLNDGGEIAVVDVREGGPYARGHILVSTNIPRSKFETTVARLLPRRSVRLVLVDDDGSRLDEPARFLESCGYSAVHVLDRGNTGWTDAGFRLHSGSNIVSKVFGEIVEETCGTPHIEARTLESWMSQGRPFHLFDVRPLAEYRTVSIPGATNCPGMETAVRIPALLEDESIPIVVNCAGRTRSIIGAQTLRDAGVTNPVFALKNGTMGWQLEGLEPDHGRSNMVGEPFGDDLGDVRRAMSEFAARNRVDFVDFATVQTWLADESRTTHLFDVRLGEAHAFARIPGSINAPGGQLIQTTDTFVAVRNARLVLVDEIGVQAVMTAHWLSRMGWDVHVLADAVDHFTESGEPVETLLVEPDPRVAHVEIDELRELLAAHACVVIDVGESYWWRQGRIPGSHYAMRSELGPALERFDRTTTLVFCCSNGSVSPFAAGDALALGFDNVAVLAGGRAAWRRAGGDTEVVGDGDDDRLLTATDDMWYPPWARAEGAREAMAEYLSWEVGLVDRLRDEEYLHFAGDFDLPRH